MMYIYIYIYVDRWLSSTTYDCKKKNDDCISVTTVSNNRPISSERKWMMFPFVKTRSTESGESRDN